MKKTEFPKTGHESRTYYDRVVSGSFSFLFLFSGSPHLQVSFLLLLYLLDIVFHAHLDCESWNRTSAVCVNFITFIQDVTWSTNTAVLNLLSVVLKLVSPRDFWFTGETRPLRPNQQLIIRCSILSSSS